MVAAWLAPSSGCHPVCFNRRGCLHAGQRDELLQAKGLAEGEQLDHVPFVRLELGQAAADQLGQGLARSWALSESPVAVDVDERVRRHAPL